jgi:hypothetical protein
MQRDVMQNDDLDRILATNEEMLPSSGFADSVMQAVRQEAATPPPIQFPWRQAIPGMSAVVAAFASIALAFVHFLRAPAVTVDYFAILSPLKQVVEAAVHFGVGWIAFALLLSLASVALSMRI